MSHLSRPFPLTRLPVEITTLICNKVDTCSLLNLYRASSLLRLVIVNPVVVTPLLKDGRAAPPALWPILSELALNDPEFGAWLFWRNELAGDCCREGDCWNYWNLAQKPFVTAQVASGSEPLLSQDWVTPCPSIANVMWLQRTIMEHKEAQGEHGWQQLRALLERIYASIPGDSTRFERSLAAIFRCTLRAGHLRLAVMTLERISHLLSPHWGQCDTSFGALKDTLSISSHVIGHMRGYMLWELLDPIPTLLLGLQSWWANGELVYDFSSPASSPIAAARAQYHINPLHFGILPRSDGGFQLLYPRVPPNVLRQALGQVFQQALRFNQWRIIITLLSSPSYNYEGYPVVTPQWAFYQIGIAAYNGTYSMDPQQETRPMVQALTMLSDKLQDLASPFVGYSQIMTIDKGCRRGFAEVAAIKCLRELADNVDSLDNKDEEEDPSKSCDDYLVEVIDIMADAQKYLATASKTAWAFATDRFLRLDKAQTVMSVLMDSRFVPPPDEEGKHLLNLAIKAAAQSASKLRRILDIAHTVHDTSCTAQTVLETIIERNASRQASIYLASPGEVLKVQLDYVEMLSNVLADAATDELDRPRLLNSAILANDTNALALLLVDRRAGPQAGDCQALHPGVFHHSSPAVDALLEAGPHSRGVLELIVAEAVAKGGGEALRVLVK